jgi:hypothetical protein
VPLACALLFAGYMTTGRYKQAVDITLWLIFRTATVLRMFTLFGSTWLKEEGKYSWWVSAPNLYFILELGLTSVWADRICEHSVSHVAIVNVRRILTMIQDYKYPTPFAVEDWETKQVKDREHACEKCTVRPDVPEERIQPIRWSWQLEAAGIATVELALSIVRCMLLLEVSGGRPDLREAPTTEEVLTLILAVSFALWGVARRRRRQDLPLELHLAWKMVGVMCQTFFRSLWSAREQSTLDLRHRLLRNSSILGRLYSKMF